MPDTLNHVQYPRSVKFVVGNSLTDGPFPIPFPFYDLDTVQVFINGVEEHQFTITQASIYDAEGNTLTLSVPVSNADVVVWSSTGPIRSTGKKFVQTELSKEIDRIFANFQEMWERGLWLEEGGDAFDAQGNRITNLADPINPQDAATMGWVERLYEALLVQLEGMIGEAEGALNAFRRLYLGAFEVDPTADFEGEPLMTGALYFNIPGVQLRVWNGTNWTVLSDLADVGTELPPIQDGDGTKFLAVKADESGYEYVSIYDDAAAGDSVLILTSVDGPSGADNHIPFGSDGGDAGNQFVAPYDMTFSAATMRVTRDGGLREDMSVSVRINGVDTVIFSEVAGYEGTATAAPAITLAPGDTVSFVYTCGNNYNLSVAFGFHFSGGFGGGRSLLTARRLSFPSFAAKMNFGQATSYFVTPALPVAVTLHRARYRATAPATQTHVVTIHDHNDVELASQTLGVGEQDLDFDNLNTELEAGDGFYAKVDADSDGGSGYMTFEVLDDAGPGGISRPMLLLEYGDLSAAGTEERLSVPFSGTITAASFGSLSDMTNIAFTVSVNGGSAQALIAANGAGPHAVSTALDVAFSAGDLLTIAHTGSAATGAGGLLSLTFEAPAIAVAGNFTLPPVKAGYAGRVLTVNDLSNGIEWQDPTGKAGDLAPYRWWRVVGKTNDSTYWAIAELALFDSEGTNLTPAGSPHTAASTNRTGFERGKAFDGNPATCWSPTENEVDPWIGYDFGFDAGGMAAVARVEVTARNDGFEDQTPRDFDVEVSNDGVNWEPFESFTGVDAYSSGETKSFVLVSQGSAPTTGDKGDKGTSVLFGSDTTSAREGDVYYHDNGNIYGITTEGSDHTAQTLMGPWKVRSGWEPYGGASTNPRFFVHTSNVSEIVFPDFEPGYEYMLSMSVVHASTFSWVLLDFQKEDGVWIAGPYGEFGAVNQTTSFIGRTFIPEPRLVQDWMIVESQIASITFGKLTDTHGSTRKSMPYVYAPASPAAFQNGRLRMQTGYFGSGSWCELLRRAL